MYIFFSDPLSDLGKLEEKKKTKKQDLVLINSSA